MEVRPSRDLAGPKAVMRMYERTYLSQSHRNPPRYRDLPHLCFVLNVRCLCGFVPNKTQALLASRRVNVLGGDGLHTFGFDSRAGWSQYVGSGYI